MLIEKLWMNNPLRNYNYIAACPDSGEAMAIDPLDADKVLAAAKRRGWTIKQVLNTHEHDDHIAGNRNLVGKTGATLLAPAVDDGNDPIAWVDVALRLKEGDTVAVGTSVTLDVLETPGHTMCHISLLSRTNPPHLFCGDTVFNAGAGNCHNGGDPATLYRAFAEKIFKLPGNALIYPGHEYFETNLKFTLDREPGNDDARKTLADVRRDHNPDDPLVCTTLDMERRHNVFFRLDNEEIIANLRKKFPDMSDAPDAEEVFIKLRQLRNNW